MMPADQAIARVLEARNRGDEISIATTAAATVIVISARAEVRELMVSLADAARLAATTLGVIRRAARDGAIATFGGERDRSVRRADLDAWIESRRVRRRSLVSSGPDDTDIDRRMGVKAKARQRDRGKEKSAWHRLS